MRVIENEQGVAPEPPRSRYGRRPGAEAAVGRLTAVLGLRIREKMDLKFSKYFSWRWAAFSLSMGQYMGIWIVEKLSKYWKYGYMLISNIAYRYPCVLTGSDDMCDRRELVRRSGWELSCNK